MAPSAAASVAQAPTHAAQIEPAVGDAEVIDAVLGGDLERYAELVRRYQAAAWGLAYRFVGNAEDAKELSQNGFVKAYRHLRRFRRRAAFSTWLYRIIVNECKDFCRRRARQPRVASLSRDPDAADPQEPLMFDVEDPRADPGAAAANEELARSLQRAIDELAAHRRTAFVLHHLNGMSLEQVAQVMGCRIGTVKAHVFRACEQLRARLAPYL